MSVHKLGRDTLRERATELFSLCDQESKGYITQNDLVAVITDLELPLDAAQVQQAFSKLDDDQNGYLTLEEFTAGFGLFLGLDGVDNDGDLDEIATSDPGRELFYLCDSDRKGYITKTDLHRVAVDLSLNFDQLDLIFNQLDQDGNGRLTLDEFVLGFGKFLSGAESEDEQSNGFIEDQDNLDGYQDPSSDVFENISSEEGSPTVQEDPMFSEVVETVGEDVLSGALSKDQLRDLWESLQHNDSRAVQKFQDFLTKVSAEIRRARNDSEQLETALKSKMNSHDTEVQKLYEEMEQQIKVVRDTYQQEQQKREKQIKTELMSELERKEMEIQWMMNKQKKLEDEIAMKEKGEQEIKTENEKLLEKNWTLEEQLNSSVSSLEDTRSYVHQLQAMTAEEKKERARAAMRVTEGMQREQQSLIEQLDMLREINQKLRDDRDAIEAAHQAMLMTKRDRGSSLGDEIEEAEGKKKVNRQGSKMSKYWDKRQNSNGATSPTSPRGQLGSIGSIAEEGETGEEFNLHRSSERNKPRRKSSRRRSRMKKQNNVLANYYSSNVEGLSSSDQALELSALTREVEFEGDEELAKIIDDKPPERPIWARKIMAAFEESEKAKKEKEEKDKEEFRQRKADLLSSDLRSSEDERSAFSDAFNSSSELESDSSCPRSPRTAPVGKDDEAYHSASQASPTRLKTPERVFKVVFIGDSGVGKSSFLHRFCHDQWKPSFTATIGVDFQIKTMNVNGQCIAIQLWDTAGQERFRSITKQYFRKADGILIFYDVTAESSFTNLKSWMVSVEEGAEEGVAKMVLGNKTDLAEDEESRVVKTIDGKNLANQYDALYMETSAKTGNNIQEAMYKLAEVLQAREDQMMQSVLTLANTSKKKKKCCKS
ncbi:EF-hand calcium-binding domain-containing protein 4B isoform X2 [Nematostella vectensis]|uniref:EF-hand calcium-binding domain-containing protein 4B isoform X2 n=1 Tax=Nematostella vectensis TaxID=45351 RepID=UPI002076D68C|nr:EF-hand calcium-binding domain-containing protein 4B isoform X2 [Nematostella vectensis]